jgi:HK97 gp10 family phage protein
MASMIESKELDKLNKDLSKIGKELFKTATKIPDEITKRLAMGAIDIRDTIILSMRNTPKKGRIYKRGKKKHISSSPGNPPAIDRGELVRSITFDVGEMEVEIGAEAGAPYASFLETGTKKMEARPFLDPAVEKHRQEIIDDIGEKSFELIQSSFEGI